MVMSPLLPSPPAPLLLLVGVRPVATGRRPVIVYPKRNKSSLGRALSMRCARVVWVLASLVVAPAAAAAVAAVAAAAVVAVAAAVSAPVTVNPPLLPLLEMIG